MNASPYDTITGIRADENGVLTEIDYIGGSCADPSCLAGMTLEGFDQTLQTYDVLGVDAADQLQTDGLADYLGPISIRFPRKIRFKEELKS